MLVITTNVVVSQTDSLQSTDPFDYINEANLLASVDATKAFTMAEKALELSLESQNKRAEAYCYSVFGSVHYEVKKYNLAIESFTKAQNKFNVLKEDKGIYLTTKYLAQAYDANLNTKIAINKYEVFLDLAIQKGNEKDVNEAKNALGRLYFNFGNYDMALSIFKVQLKKAEHSGSEADIAEISNRIGKIYDVQNDSVAALKNYKQGLASGLNSANNEAVQGYYDNMNSYYGSRGNVKEQLNVNDEAIQHWTSEKKKKSRNKNQNKVEQKEIKDLNTNLFNANMSQANVWLNTNNPVEAMPFIINSIDIATDIGTLENEVKGYGALVEAYEQVGEYDKALEAYKRFVVSKDSLEAERQQEKLFALRLEADVYDRDKRIQLLQREADLDRQTFDLTIREKDDEANASKIFMYSLMAGFGVLLISFIVFVRGNREKKKANKLLMLKSLRTQMNPHFIFNSLNSVNSFISQSDERSANKYLSEFSKLMRMVLENSKFDFVSLSSELKTLELYLGLEHLRFKDKFDYNLNIEVNGSEDIEVPPMLVQPYIENAVWHGLRYSENKGKLDVSCIEKDGNLHWTIEDDGIGREKSKELKTKHQKEGKSTGMKNIEERLRIIKELYGHEMQLEVSNLNEDGSGTRVKLIIPKRKAA